jgi:hypothetical protein
MNSMKWIRILFINNVNVYIKCYLIPDNLMTLLSLPDFINEWNLFQKLVIITCLQMLLMCHICDVYVTL